MLKLFIGIFLSVFMTASFFSQDIAPQSVNSANAHFIQSNGSLTYTVGELVILSSTDSNGNYLGSGFTSGATLSTATVIEPNQEILNVSVYPNPSTSLITIDIQHSKVEQVIIEITDLNGKVILTERHSGIVNKIGINATNWPTGNYLISLKDAKNGLIGSYKVIKQ